MAALGLAERLPRGAVAELEAATSDPDPRVRAAAVAALVRAAVPRRAATAWRRALADPAPEVRRRAAELTPTLAPTNLRPLRDLLTDPDVTVLEATAWALGELGDTGAVPKLAQLATGHDDPIAREAAVAALGAIADPTGLPPILSACNDKPAVRRRAVLALAPFEGPEVDAALENALKDRDWQTRQAAEDLKG